MFGCSRVGAGWVYLVILAALSVVSCKPGKGCVQAEIDQMRRLAAKGDMDELANTLDRSMVKIPAGEFTMGSQSGNKDEQPPRQIYLDPFQIDRYEVTNAQYRRFLLETGGRAPQHWAATDYPAGQGDWPVTGVSWLEASAYCQWVGKRLPSEAEWEKACRGRDANRYPWGDEWEPGKANTGLQGAAFWPATVEDIWRLLEANAADYDDPHPSPVGSYPRGASAYGVMDMAGNASEWVQDWYNWQGYQDIAQYNPVGSGPPWNHSLRGSGWVDKEGEQHLVKDLSRCAKRNSAHTSNDPRLGFRCARG